MMGDFQNGSLNLPQMWKIRADANLNKKWGSHIRDLPHLAQTHLNAI